MRHVLAAALLALLLIALTGCHEALSLVGYGYGSVHEKYGGWDDCRPNRPGPGYHGGHPYHRH